VHLQQALGTYAFCPFSSSYLHKPTMSEIGLNDQHVRNRKPHSQDEGPLVPPKEFGTANTIRPARRIAAPSPLNLHRLSKPLPCVPRSPVPSLVKEEAWSKPLPAPPLSFTLRSTLLWIAAFCVWFLLIVVLLPVITEKDAMPGFNKWLRTLL
jgi:hypothetical protein